AGRRHLRLSEPVRRHISPRDDPARSEPGPLQAALPGRQPRLYASRLHECAEADRDRRRPRPAAHQPRTAACGDGESVPDGGRAAGAAADGRDAGGVTMVRSPLFLALDAGTTSFKAILFDAEGHAVAHERVEIRLHHPRPLWAEVDAEDWWRAAVERVPRLFERSGAAPDVVAAIGVTGAMHALVPVGTNGAVLGSPLTWFDQRCRPQVEALRERAAEAFEPVGGISIASTSARLCWLRENSPEVVERTHSFLLPKDFLR